MTFNRRIERAPISNVVAEKNLQGNHSCKQCGARLKPIPSDQPRIGEMLLTVVCGVLVIVLFSATCCFFNSLFQEAVHHLSDRLVWHEPLDDWNM
jgi:hypothetical protein